jgi:predicted 2-oxoglutarate/Fe(II)-dependent dioxygenase YbiX
MINYQGIVFTKEDCEDIKKIANEWSEAKLLVKRGLGEIEDVVVQNKRYNKASYFKLKSDSPYYQKLNDGIKNFGYELVADELDAGILKYEKGNFIFLHTDLPMEGEKRFFCIVTQLSEDSDYVGGDFRYLIDNEPNTMDRNIGNSIMFKPEVLHEVTIVESGTRFSLVIWINYEQVKSLTKPSLI